MLDYEMSKKLNINAERIDLEKSYFSFNSNTCNLTIELLYKKDVEIICPIFYHFFGKTFFFRNEIQPKKVNKKIKIILNLTSIMSHYVIILS